MAKSLAVYIDEVGGKNAYKLIWKDLCFHSFSKLQPNWNGFGSSKVGKGWRTWKERRGMYKYVVVGVFKYDLSQRKKELSSKESASQVTRFVSHCLKGKAADKIKNTEEKIKNGRVLRIY